MRILFCPEYFVPSIGGGEIWSYNVAKGLAEKGHKMSVVTYKQQGHMLDEKIGNLSIIRGGTYAVNTSESYWKRALIQAPSIIRIGATTDYDIILANNTFPLLPSWFLSKIRQKPIVAAFHNFYGYRFSIEEKGAIKGVVRGSIEYVAHALNYDAILVLSTSIKDKLIKRGIPAKRISIIPGGVDLQYIDSIQEEKSKEPIVLFVGRLVHMKRVDVLLEAFRIVNEKIPESKLFVVGDGPLRPYLESLAEQHRIRDHVFFLGFVSEEEKIRIMKESDTLLFTKRSRRIWSSHLGSFRLRDFCYHN